MKLNKLFTYTDAQLKDALHYNLLFKGYNPDTMYNTKDFLYAEGDAPYMLVAHLDTVHKQAPSIICYSKDNNYIMSPQGIGGDDRCGVYIILSLLRRLPYKPYILFTMGEEVGCVGAKAFVKWLCDSPDMLPDLKFIVEYDRKGNKDCVFYNCDNKDFEKFVEGFGFKTAYGTSSDIKVIAPELGAAAVNLSSGYYNPHTEHEYVCMSDMHDVINASVEMLTAECEPFKYVAKAVTVYKGGWSNNGSKQLAGKCSRNVPYARQGSSYRQIKVTVLPKNSVYIRPTYYGSQFENLENEVAIDADGNFYRYYHTYKDWERAYNVEPMFKDKPPKFDNNKITMISVYSYYYCDYDY